MKEVGRPKHGLKASKRSLGGRLFEIQQSAEKVRRCGITGNIAIHVPPVSFTDIVEKYRWKSEQCLAYFNIIHDICPQLYDCTMN